MPGVIARYSCHSMYINLALKYVVAGFSPRAKMRNFHIRHDRTPAEAGDYIPDFICGDLMCKAA
jgi:hypothetical protein